MPAAGPAVGHGGLCSRLCLALVLQPSSSSCKMGQGGQCWELWQFSGSKTYRSSYWMGERYLQADTGEYVSLMLLSFLTGKEVEVFLAAGKHAEVDGVVWCSSGRA